MLTPEQAQRLASDILAAQRENAETLADISVPESGGARTESDGGTIESAPDEPLPEVLGRYRVLRRIARGGMGTVYEAVQDRPHRAVAVKVLSEAMIPRGRLQAALRRFEYEAEILGELRHPGIAQVYEAGLHESVEGGGRHRISLPYIVMELIPEARALTQYTEDHNLDVRAKLKLFTSVCDAVHYAHQKGVIHRDLKPANILVDVEGQAKIIDFGIARATNADVTLTLQQGDVREILGTLQYMSPEQACGGAATSDTAPWGANIDLRTDVYSLGVILYELLCGRLPYDLSSTTIPQATRIIQEHEPQRPSVIHKNLRGDLEAIVLKALEKDRERRYQSAGELAADIRRYLNGEPVEARRPSRWLRAAKWVGRHPKTVTFAGAAAILTFTLIGAFIVAAYLNSRPAYFTVAEDHSSVQLRSSTGYVLWHWNNVSDDVRVAMMARRPKQFGGGKVVLLATHSLGSPTDGQLWVCDPSDMTMPLWRTEPRPPYIASPLNDGIDERYKVGIAMLADVFEESPGDEIIVVHAHHCCSSYAVRVYDFGGNVHFEAWHLGPIHGICWLARPRLLVCIGDRHGEHGNPLKFKLPGVDYYPQVVFAIRPQWNARLEWIYDGRDVSPDPAMVWYRCLLPPERWNSYRFMIGERWQCESREDVTHVKVRLDETAQFAWLIDADGRIVPNGTIVPDNYAEAITDGVALRPEEFWLGDCPTRGGDAASAFSGE